MDSLRYFVDRLPRRRVPLRPRVRARARVLRGRSPVGVLRHRSTRIRCSRQVKLIAEPWDVGPGGYQVGNFPVLWTEWNGLYRDTMRDFWRGHDERRGLRHALHRARATSTRRTGAARSRRSTSSRRTTGSRSPTSSRTTTSTTRRTSRTNRDGTDDNRSWNCGVEGPTDDPSIRALRAAAAAQLPRRRCSSRRACRCCSAATSSAARSTATTTRGARTTSSRGSTGTRTTTSSAARVHAAADRSCGARTRSSGARRSSRAAAARRRPARRVVVPARRAADDAAATGSRGDARALGVFLNGEEIPTRTPEGEPIVDDSLPAALQRPLRADRRSSCRRGASGRAGSSSSRPRSPKWRRVALVHGARGRAGRVALGRRAAAAAGELDAATYRLQLRPGFGFDEARASSCRTCASSAISHLYLSPSWRRGTGSTHGYDVVDPTRVSEELGGEEAFRALAGAGLGVVLDVVPNHMADERREPVLGRSGAAARSSSTGTGDRLVPPLLRRSTSWPACAWRIPRSSS